MSLKHNVEKKRNAGAVKQTKEEIQTLIREKKLEKDTQVWNYFCNLISFKRRTSEMDDVKATLDDMKKNGILHKLVDGIYVSKKTMSLKLEEYYIAHRRDSFTLKKSHKIVKDVWKLTDKQLQDQYNEWMLK